MHLGKRGVYDFGSPVLRAGDIFGFFSRQKSLKAVDRVVVYPRPLPIRPVCWPKKELYGAPQPQGLVQDPVHIYGVRDYLPGRPARNIHWKASARHCRLQEKLCDCVQVEKGLVLLDVEGFGSPEDEPAFEKVLGVMASVFLQMERRGLAVGFATNGLMKGNGPRILPISKNPSQLPRILEALARVTSNKEQALVQVLEKGCAEPGGAAGLCFVKNKGPSARAVASFMKTRRIPVRFLAAQSPGPEQAAKHTMDKFDPGTILHLDDILLAGAETV